MYFETVNSKLDFKLTHKQNYIKCLDHSKNKMSRFFLKSNEINYKITKNLTQPTESVAKQANIIAFS